MQTASVSPGPFNVVAAGGCRLKFWHLQAAVARPLPCLHDTPVTPHVRAAAPNAAAAAAACIFPAPAVLRPGAATVLRASPAAGRSTAAAGDLSSACTSPRGNLSGIWGSAGYGGAAAIATAATRLNKSWAAARSFRPAQQLLLAIFSFTAAAAARSRGPRALGRSTGRSMRRLTSLSPTLPVKAPAALAAAEEGHPGHDVIVNVPRLLYGTAWKKERTEDLVYTALRHGFRGVDTACQPKHYNEPGVGRGIARFLRETQLPRNSLFIQTKFTPVDGHDLSQPLPYDARASVTQQVQQSLQTSLHNLQCDYLDAVLLHSPLPTMAQTIEAWRVLEAAAEEGKVRLLGISNCYDVSTLEALYRAAKVKPALLQNRFYSATAYDAEVRITLPRCPAAGAGG